MIGALYKILGVKPGASAAEVKAAYRARAKASHPDAGGDLTEFQDVSRAYGVLGDPAKRLAYDSTGSEDTPSTESAAVMILRKLVENTIASPADPLRTDFVAGMRQQLKEGLSNIARQTNDATTKINRCQIMMGRFKAKSGNNMIARVIEGRIAEMERQAAGFEVQRTQIEAALQLLDVYSYAVDPVQQHAAASSGTSGWGLQTAAAARGFF